MIQVPEGGPSLPDAIRQLSNLSNRMAVPEMASASVGIAIGTAGSDVALESADVVLMADNLDHLPLTIELSHATRHIIHQNLWMSLAMVAYLVSATIFGLNIGPAVALHEGSTLVGVTGYCT